MGGGSIIKVKLNKSIIINTFLGLVIALIFDDMKELIINEIILKFVNKNVEKKNILVFNTKLDLQKIVDLLVNIILSMIFIGILYYHS
tara:strand:- start:294 stop:557 length:264 start_codon:yes stop_codon:yes gene_type:complete